MIVLFQNVSFILSTLLKGRAKKKNTKQNKQEAEGMCAEASYLE